MTHSSSPFLSSLTLTLTLTLVGCGSAPAPRPPAAVSAPQEALRIGMQLYGDDEYRGAEEMFGRALDLYRSVDDRAGQVTALVDLADVALILGEHERAAAFVASARSLVEREPLAAFTARLDLLAAQARVQAGKGGEARAALEALALSPDASIRDAAVLERARVALDAGEDPQPWLARAGGNAQPRWRGKFLRLSAEAARKRGDAAGAAAQLEQALALYRSDAYRPGIAAANEELAALAAAGRNWDEAADRYGRALDVRFFLRDRVHAVADLEALRAVEKARGDGPRAERLTALAADVGRAAASQWSALAAAWRSPAVTEAPPP